MSQKAVKQVKPMPVEPYRPFPVDLLPGVVQRFVVEASESIGCDPAYVALPMLSALASAIGATRVIALKSDWLEPPIFWTAVIGESGTHKTPAQKAALAALREIESRLFTQFDESLQLHEEELAQYEDEKRQWRKVKHGPPPTEPQPPTRKRVICGDTTVEALAGLLDQNPRGLLLSRDELSGWFGSFNAYKPGAGDESIWLELHQGNTINIDRKTGPKPMIHVPRPSLSLTGGVQPGILQDLLSKAKFDSGMVARFLMAYPPKQAKRWTEQELHADTKAAMQSIFEALHTMIGTEEGEPISVMLSSEAKTVWVDHYNEHAQEQAGLSGPLAAAWSKLEAYAARLALILHEVRIAEHDPSVIDRYTVDEQSIKGGIDLARWFGLESKRIYAYLQGNEVDRQWHKVAEFITRKDGEATARELQRGLYQGECMEAVTAELSAFVDNGWLDRVDAPSSIKGGRPSKAYRLAKGMAYDKTPGYGP